MDFPVFRNALEKMTRVPKFSNGLGILRYGVSDNGRTTMLSGKIICDLRDGSVLWLFFTRLSSKISQAADG